MLQKLKGVNACLHSAMPIQKWVFYFIKWQSYISEGPRLYKAKCAIYHSLIHSHLSYCNIVWINSIKKSQLNRLKILQEKALRALFNAKYNTHTAKFFEHSGITRVENIFLRESLLITHKFHNKSLPSAINRMFKESICNPSFLTRSMSNCVMQPKRDSIGLTIYNIINNWNALGNSIREIKSFKVFKKSISDLLNENYKDCTKLDCYSCKYDFSKIRTYIKK